MSQEPRASNENREGELASNEDGQSSTERTSRLLGFLLVAIYGGTLVGIGIVAAVTSFNTESRDLSAIWIDLFKSGFLILGGAVSTIVGYYFGSRGIQAAEQRSAMSLAEARLRSQEAQRRAEEAERLWQEIGRETEITEELPAEEGGLVPPEDYREGE